MFRKTRHMNTATRPLSSLWATARTRLRDSRREHAARASLARELESYNSPDDLNDLYAILDRYSDHDTAGIRRILAAQRSF
jgi:hypothetical protein